MPEPSCSSRTAPFSEVEQTLDGEDRAVRLLRDGVDEEGESSVLTSMTVPWHDTPWTSGSALKTRTADASRPRLSANAKAEVVGSASRLVGRD